MLLAVFAFWQINGAHRWIKFQGFSMQPSELSKLALVIFLAYFLEKRAGEEGDLLAHVCSVRHGDRLACRTGRDRTGLRHRDDAGGYLRRCDLHRRRALASSRNGCGAGVSLVAAGLLIFVPWRMKRLITFLDPWADQQGGGFQVVQSLIAIGSGGTNGLGFAQGKQKMMFLPFAHSDFIFAVVGEELGLGRRAGGGCGICTVSVARRCARRCWRRIVWNVVSLGIVTSIVAQALSISVWCSRSCRQKEFPLPFISYGGSSLVPTLAAVGILLNISQHASGVRRETARARDVARRA